MSTIAREPVTHDLKIYPEYFSAVCTGVKRAELRKNDRDYRAGDTLHLMETPRESCHATGEFINVTITHVAAVGEWMPGYVLLSIALASLEAEPVAMRWRYLPDGIHGMGEWNYRDQGYIDTLNAYHLSRQKDLLYTAPPAPVSVPDEATPENIEILASTFHHAALPTSGIEMSAMQQLTPGTLAAPPCFRVPKTPSRPPLCRPRQLWILRQKLPSRPAATLR